MSQFNTRGMFLFLCLALCLHGWAQSIEQILKADKAVQDFSLHPLLKTPSVISFQNGALADRSAQQVLNKYFPIPGGAQLQSVGVTELPGNIRLEKFKLYFKGIRVEHSAYNVVSRAGNIFYITAEAYPIEAQFATSPQISEEEARARALDFVKAEKYVWEALEEDKALYPGNNYMLFQLEVLKQQYTPKAELVIAKDLFGTKQARLAYKFDIYAVTPLSRNLVYVDALDGRILLSDAVIKHADQAKKGPKPDSLYYLPNFQYYQLAAPGQLRYAPPQSTASVLGTGQTRYSGTRQIYTTRISVPLTGAQDPNNPASPLLFSGVDPRLPVTGSADVYILRDDTRGGGIETYDCNAVGGLPLSLPGIHAQALAFVDRDNNWKDEADNGLISQEDHKRGASSDGSNGAAEAANDDVAIDAHWGAAMVYDYWKQKHNRLSFDNKNTAIRSYVHYGPAYDNAFWNGSVMTYGDGSGTLAAGFRPLVSLDVCGHEIGHGVCSFTSDLVYQSESGAMNEGLSDIWAACVERFVKENVDNSLNYQYFQIGEQIAPDNIGLRRMDNPKAKTDPDTYGGRYWVNPDCTPTLANDQCGVHTNSGVLNKWFYLLVQGPNTTTGSPAFTDDGIADRPRTTPGGSDWIENAGNNYGSLPNFIGLGFDKAEAITYLMELSLTPNATFADARNASVLAAKVLYGPCSQEEISVTNAWYAVNVGAAWNTCTAPVLSVNLLTTTVTEGSGECGSYSEYTIGVSLAQAQATSTVINFSTGSGTAEAHDFQLSSNVVTYNPGETGNRTITLRIYNDDMVEGNETIVLQATSALAAFNFNETITVLDDDVEPRIGNSFTVFTENFEGVADDNLPPGWLRVDKTNPSGGRWNVRQAPGVSTISWTTKRAYVYNPNLPALQNQPLYDIHMESDIILRTPLIDARGLDSLRLSFVWSAGGEAACDPACDYGEVVYSFDGVNFNRFDPDTSDNSRTASEALYMSLIDSSYNHLLPAVVSNKQFYLGFRWVNDALAATSAANSITIDNIVLTGQGRKIETDSASGVSTVVRVEAGNPVYFYSRDDKGLLSKIVNASADLGCVKDSLIQTGNGTVNYPGGRRTRKVFEITPSQNSNASYNLTLYFTTSEVAGFLANPSQLRILKSNAVNIDQSNASNSIIVSPIFVDSSAQGFYAYSANFTGFSKFALVEPLTAPLPVNCLDFRAVKNGQAVTLNWRVSEEINNKHFEIERSSDGINYSTIGLVAAVTNGNGQYQFTDQEISGLRNGYYRLRQVDQNGDYRYLCTVLFVSFDKNALTIGNIYPNPGEVKARVHISSSQTRKLKIEIINAAGQMVDVQNEQVQAGATVIAIDVRALAAGSYLIRFKDEEGRVLRAQQYIKQ